MNPYLQTISNGTRVFDFDDTKSLGSALSITDIARGLSNVSAIPQMKDFYSYAQRSVLMTNYVQTSLELMTLLYYAPIAYVGAPAEGVDAHAHNCLVADARAAIYMAIFDRELTEEQESTIQGASSRVRDDIESKWLAGQRISKRPLYPTKAYTEYLESMSLLLAKNYDLTLDTVEL